MLNLLHAFVFVLASQPKKYKLTLHQSLLELLAERTQPVQLLQVVQGLSDVSHPKYACFEDRIQLELNFVEVCLFLELYFLEFVGRKLLLGSLNQLLALILGTINEALPRVYHQSLERDQLG